MLITIKKSSLAWARTRPPLSFCSTEARGFLPRHGRKQLGGNATLSYIRYKRAQFKYNIATLARFVVEKLPIAPADFLSSFAELKFGELKSQKFIRVRFVTRCCSAPLPKTKLLFVINHNYTKRCCTLFVSFTFVPLIRNLTRKR